MESGGEVKDRKRNGLILHLPALVSRSFCSGAHWWWTVQCKDGFNGPVGSRLESGEQQGEFG